jgi:hypothetical protein
VRRLVAADPTFCALCHEHGKVIDLTEAHETQKKGPRKGKADKCCFATSACCRRKIWVTGGRRSKSLTTD